jgi:transcriptional regulator with XRE-family HTH domain
LEFGVWLAQRRKQAGLTLRELASKSGLSFPYVAALERSTSEPPPRRTCKALARGLGIRWEEVWQRSFVARLRKWLRRQDAPRILTDEITDLASKVDTSGRKTGHSKPKS